VAIGDYSKTTYSNGGSPALNETNLNNNEEKTSELDSHLDDYELGLIYGVKW